MRTTVNVEDDVFFAAKAIAKAAHSSVGAVLSDWARIGQQQALSGATVTAGSSSGVKAKSVQTRNGIALLPKRGVMVASEQVYRLLDEDAA
jgi:hypothetical protein